MVDLARLENLGADCSSGLARHGRSVVAPTETEPQMATTATTARYPLSAQDEPALRPNVRNRVGVGHALIDDCSFDQACESIVAHARSGGRPSFVTTAN